MFPLGHATATGHAPAEVHVWRLLAEHLVALGKQSVQPPATQALLVQEEGVVGQVPESVHFRTPVLPEEHFVLAGMQSEQAPLAQALLGQDEAVVGHVPSEPQVRTPLLSDEHCVPGAQMPLH
jgi:hypothetical protein